MGKFTLVLVLFSWQVAADAVINMSHLLQNARSGAFENLQFIVDSVSRNSPLHDELQSCSGDSGVFRPDKVQLPTEEELCALIPEIDLNSLRGPFTGIVDRDPETWIAQSQVCKFSEFTACNLEFFVSRKHIETIVLPGWSISLDGTPPPKRLGPPPKENLGVTVIRCRPVALLGVVPQWVCGIGSDDAWQSQGKVIAGRQKWQELDPRHLRPKALKRFLQRVGLVEVQACQGENCER